MASNVPLLDNDDIMAFGEENEPKKILKHPIVTLFHLLFRGAALVTYVICDFFGGFIASFVVIVLLLSMDFWTVKNITGRLMVGLRWWNYIDDEGKSHWVFEAKKGRVSATEVQIFWVALIVTPVVWGVFLFIALFSFKPRWFMVVCIALSLSGSNLYGYIRCKIGKSQSITDSVKNMASGMVQRQMLNNVTNMFAKAPPSATPSNTV
ncbi:putative Golgi apparatus membrane protein-like protein CG5021 isoform X2 [Oratosquilla oratoria]|uniref:putative Golgi apparatus membrane protein-like protein CG5021 isoform X2 n=1 Tax=Oratosquilla oratoria TaxID=337810 RepID=UPI003F777F33